MTPRDHVNLVLRDLQAFAGETEGLKLRVDAAADPWSALDPLTSGGGGYVAIVVWEGDAPDGPVRGLAADEDGVSWVDSNLGIYVGRQMGLDAGRPAPALLGKADGKAGLLDLVANVRKRLLSLQLPDTGETLPRHRYMGCAPATTPEGYPLMAYRLRVALAAAIDPGEARESASE